MTDEEVLDYYNPGRYEPKQAPIEHSWLWKVGEFISLAILMLLIVPLVLLIIIVVVPTMWICEKFKPTEESLLAKELSEKDIKLIAGYDGKDKTAAELIKRLEEKYGTQMESFDWSYFTKWSKDNASKKDQRLMKLINSTIEYPEDDEIEPVPPYVFSEDPCKLYIIALNKKHNYVRVSTYPVLDEWYLPTKVLPAETLLDRVDDFFEKEN